MKRLLIISAAALALVTAPLGSQVQANDAHHPDKTAKTKKKTSAKTKQTKKPSVQSDTSH